jgi:X-domain of DnaJ-containing
MYESSPGFFSRLKEKGAMVKDAWSVISSALGVQSVLIDMQKTLEKGEVPEEELRALESDVTGKVSSLIIPDRFSFLCSKGTPGYLAWYAHGSDACPPQSM